MPNDSPNRRRIRCIGLVRLYARMKTRKVHRDEANHGDPTTVKLRAERRELPQLSIAMIAGDSPRNLP